MGDVADRIHQPFEPAYRPGVAVVIHADMSVDVFREMFQPVTAFNSKAHIEITADAVTMHATDEARVAWVDIHVVHSAFEFIQAGDTPASTALDVNGLLDVFSIPPADTITMTIPTTHEVHITANQLQYRTGTLREENVPEVWLRSEPGTEIDLTTSPAMLSKVIGLAVDMTDRVEFGTTPTEKSAYIAGTGDTDDVRVDIALSNTCEALGLSVEESYSLTYLDPIQQRIPADRPVQLQWGPDSPLQVQYPVAAGHGTVTYTIRPNA